MREAPHLYPDLPGSRWHLHWTQTLGRSKSYLVSPSPTLRLIQISEASSALQEKPRCPSWVDHTLQGPVPAPLSPLPFRLQSPPQARSSAGSGIESRDPKGYLSTCVPVES